MACKGCSLGYIECIQLITSDSAAIQVFQAHGVIPTSRVCPKCGNNLTFRQDKNLFVCHHKIINPKNKRVIRCVYSCSLFHNTWLSFDRANLSPSKNLLFCNIFLRKHFTQSYAENYLHFSSETAVDWRLFCGEICENWFEHQSAIGGPNIVVEIDESKFGKCKDGRGREIHGIWLFGGIESISKKRFVWPVEQSDEATLIPLIQRFILPGSIIHSDCCKEYSFLNTLGYTHKTVNNSENFVDPVTHVHTRNIKRVWRDIKSWVLRSGVKTSHYKMHLARYLFQSNFSDPDTILHNFLLNIAQLYPPPN